MIDENKCKNMFIDNEIYQVEQQFNNDIKDEIKKIKDTTIECPICRNKIKIALSIFIEEYHEDMYITHEMEYRERKSLEKKVTNLQEENERLNNIIEECAEDILKELEENHYLSYGVALAIRQKLIDYRELKEGKIDEKTKL